MKKVVLVVGGSRGIGKKLVTGLLEHGFSVNEGSRVTGCDVRDSGDIEDLINETLEKRRKIDVLVYNAGLMLYDNVVDIDDYDLDKMYEVIVRGYVYACRAVLPIMQKQGYGHIINISSTRGLTTAPGKGAYSAMKRASTSLTESVLIENKEYDIRATSLHFGVIDTESSRQRYGKMLKTLFPITEQRVLETVLFVLANSYVSSITVGGKL